MTMRHEPSLDIAQRVTALEFQRSWLKWGLITIAVGLAIVALVAADRDDAEKSVDASRFILRDKKGKPRAVLGTSDEGYPGFVLLDEAGKDKFAVATLTNGTTQLRLDGKCRVSIQSDADGNCDLAISDERRVQRLVVGLTKVDGAHMLLRDGTGENHIKIHAGEKGAAFKVFTRNGECALQLGTEKSDEVYINLYGKGQSPRLQINVLPDGTTAIAMYDAGERNRARLRVSHDGVPDLHLFDAKERARIGAYLTVDGEPVLHVYDENGKPRP